jgi:Flp pilus assembly protein TadD
MKLLLATASLAVVGCADSGELKIRAIADPLTKAVKPGNPLLGEARGLLALGNVGLAIEAYRKVLRAQPDSIEALAGLAECYDQMGRHDLARVK